MDVLAKTEFEGLGDDIVIIRHRDGVQIGRADILAGIAYVRKVFPGRRLVLVDHRYSYSLDYGAIEALRATDAFDAMASWVSNPGLLARVKSGREMFRFPVPYEVFGDRDKAVGFLRRHAQNPPQRNRHSGSDEHRR